MKVCTKCGIEKDLKFFTKQSSNPDGCHSWCKECKNKSTKDKEVLRRWRLDCIKDIACQDCGIWYDHICMDFHHRDESTKSFSIADNVKRNWGSIMSEIKKCDIICSNCHRLRHVYG